MDNKTLLAVIVTALIVALVTSLVTVKLTGNIIYTPNYVAQNQTAVYTKAEIDGKFANVRANSCDADGICELISLNTPFKADVDTDIQVYDALRLRNSRMNQSGIVFAPFSKGFVWLFTTADGSYGDYALNINAGNRSVFIHDLANSTDLNKAYVCVDNPGRLYRSSKPYV